MSSLLLSVRRVTRAVVLIDGLLGLVEELSSGRGPGLAALAGSLATRSGRPGRRLAAVALTLLLTSATSAVALPVGRRLAAGRLRSMLPTGGH